MKLPEIRTKHKIRDSKICSLYIDGEKTIEEIASSFNISTTRVYQIVYSNRDLIQIDQGWEKKKRIRWLRNQIIKRGDTKKDSAELQEQLRKEIEGDKSLIDQSQHLHLSQVTVVIDERGKISPAHQPRNRIQSGEQVPGTGSRP